MHIRNLLDGLPRVFAIDVQCDDVDLLEAPHTAGEEIGEVVAGGECRRGRDELRAGGCVDDILQGVGGLRGLGQCREAHIAVVGFVEELEIFWGAGGRD